MPDDDVIEDEGVPGPEWDSASVLELIRVADPRWQVGRAIAVGELRWRPDLIRDDPPAVLHVHAASRVRPYLLDRMRGAQQAGYEVHLAADLGALWDEGTLTMLGQLDAQVHVIDNHSVAEPKLVPAIVCDERIVLAPETRRLLGRHYWETRRQGATNHARGRRFEGLVCLLLSQIEDFRVVERNLRAATDELDAVVQMRPLSGRCWSETGVPFILVEAKNQLTSADQRDVTILFGQLQSRRGRSRIGLLISAGGFTTDAQAQELKLAFTAFTIVLVGPKEIQEWIDASDSDEYLESVVRRAMLR